MSLYGNQVTKNVSEETHDYMRECATNTSVIPSWVESFSEQSLFVAEFAESEYTKLMESVGVNELAVFESTGTFIVYEGSTFQTFKDKVLGMLKNIAGAIKGAYDKVLKYFSDKANEFKNKVLTKQFGGVKDIDFTKISKDAKLGKMHEFATDDFVGKIEEYAANANKESSDLEKTAEFNHTINTDSGNLGADSKGTSDELVSKLKDINEKLIKNISGIEAKSVTEMTKEVHKQLLGKEVDVTVDWLEKNKSGLLNELTSAASTKKSISEEYKNEKKNINDVIKKINGLKDGRNDAKVLAKYVQAEKDVISVLHGCYSATMDVFKTRYSEYRNVFARAMRAQKKSVKESAGFFAETTQEDLVSEAFNW